MLNSKGERALVYLSNVDSLEKITFLNSEGELEEAANIEVLNTGGWKLIVKKGVYEVDQLFVMAEIDTILPVDIPLFAFLEGKRIRTKKLKGVVSQGVAFTIPEILNIIFQRHKNDHNKLAEISNWALYEEWNIGDDWTELVGATKYDEELAWRNRGGPNNVKLPPANAKGNFPSFIHKTDEERIQNLAKELKYDWQGKKVVITEKLDGASQTLYCKLTNNEPLIGICSRNLDLKLDSLDNHYIKTGLPYLDKLVEYCIKNNRSLALQGEIVGPGLGKPANCYKLTEHQIYFFNVFDIDAGRKMKYNDAAGVFNDLGITSVPILQFAAIKDWSMEETLELADGFSKLNKSANREGIVVRALDGSFSFKVISNKWLLKEKE